MRNDPAMSVPVVRLEVEYMKHSILQAFSEYALKVDEDVKVAVEHFCRPDNVKAIIAKAVDASLREAITAEIDKFFRYGSGKDFIASAVKAKLDKDAEDMKRWGLA